ncbi:MAG: ABC transporter ATP-binding protein [Bacillota bacterium]
MPIIEVKDLSFGYQPKQDIFKNINFKVDEGEIFCLIGPNGCGKTTLLDCILGILSPRTGSVLVNGKNSSGIRPGDIAKQIAYIPQIHEKTFPYTVLEIVLMGRASYTSLFNSPADEDISIAEEAINRVGLMEFKNRPYTNLSGGEGRLVMIARALAQRTPLIIMDEPTSHLDFKNELNVLETVVRLVQDTGMSVVMATHFPNHAFYFENNHIATKVALMHQTEFSAVGQPSDVLTECNLRQIYQINAKLVSYSIDHIELKQIIPISTFADQQYTKEGCGKE